MSDTDSIVAELKRQATQGKSAVEIAAWLRDVLGPDASVFQFTRCLFLAFEIPLVAIREAESWSGLGPHGWMTDEELEELLSPLIVRVRPVGGPG
ncbi:hypothetical protein ACNTMW_25090 [Planosporangium sp. 12N6]|uniref:hypothetical protein n=1 Tax=Planosporangium spinosum TaxID=3402278 RepID=UPI003CF22976